MSEGSKRGLGGQGAIRLRSGQALRLGVTAGKFELAVTEMGIGMPQPAPARVVAFVLYGFSYSPQKRALIPSRPQTKA